ncbi:MAG: class II aldolase/adducin family protein [Pseudomonadota bacterium]
MTTSLKAAEREARINLACAYRLFWILGWHELIYNHISIRIPGREGAFLINPFGLRYDEVTASNLVMIDIEGRKLQPSEHEVNPAGFVVHAAVHRSRADASCVMHTHTTAGMAVACQRSGLLPLSFPAGFFTDRISYHALEGITIDEDECERIAASLGDNSVMILRNHGLLACGPTIADAFADLYHLQRACEVQIAAQAGGPLNMPEPGVMQHMSQQYARTSRGGQNTLLWAAMRRWVDDLAPGYDA